MKSLVRLCVYGSVTAALPTGVWAWACAQNHSLGAVQVVDSHMTRAEALGNNHFPADVLAKMEVVTVTYNGFDHRRHQGQIVVDRVVAKDVKHIFDEIEATGYPITKVVPIVAYKWDDQASIDDNNTSAFNYRHVIGPGQNSAKLST